MHGRITRAIHRHVSLDGATVLDFGCGSGNLSQELAVYADKVVGLDIDPDAVQTYNTNMAAHGVQPEQMRAVTTIEEVDEVVDIIVSSLVLHHIEDPGAALRKVCQKLCAGGLVAVVEVERSPGFRVHPGRIVAHPGGFDLPTLLKIMREAGLDNIRVIAIGNIASHMQSTRLLLAIGKHIVVQ